MTTFWWCLGVSIASFIAGFLVSRNNPNLKAVNKIISTGQAVIDVTGKLVKK